MKSGTNRQAWRIGAVVTLLSLALGSAAQTSPLHWGSSTPLPTNAPVAPSGVTSRQIAYVPPPRRLAPLAAGFDVHQFEATAQALVTNERVPGLAMAIVQNGRVLSERGYGTTDAQGGAPIDAHTVFRLASLSKAFAATLAGILVSDGKLRWDTPMTRYLPGLQLSRPGAAQELTVAEVLSHRVGLTHNAYDRDLEGNADYPALVQRLAYAPMTCAPGQCYAYQNVAFSLIGDVVFAATGNLYSQMVSRRIFKPLGMTDASYGLEGIEASARWARPHVRGRGGWVALTPKPSYYRVAPAAGVNASISDMAQWLIAQTGHRPDVLPESLLATLHAPVIDTPTELHGSSWRRERLNAAGYGLGWRVYDYAGHRVVFHGGAVQGYRGVVAMLPESDLGVAILWNSESSLPSGLLPTILDRALGLAPHWLDEAPAEDTLYAKDQDADESAGANSTTSLARPE